MSDDTNRIPTPREVPDRRDPPLDDPSKEGPGGVPEDEPNVPADDPGVRLPDEHDRDGPARERDPGVPPDDRRPGREDRGRA